MGRIGQVGQELGSPAQTPLLKGLGRWAGLVLKDLGRLGRPAQAPVKAFGQLGRSAQTLLKDWAGTFVVRFGQVGQACPNSIVKGFGQLGRSIK